MSAQSKFELLQSESQSKNINYQVLHDIYSNLEPQSLREREHAYDISRKQEY